LFAETNISLSFIGEVDSRYNVFLLPVERKDRQDILDECSFLQANVAKKKFSRYQHFLKHIAILSNLGS
jgi:hypothetical protein